MIYKSMFIAVIAFSAGLAVAEPVVLTAEQQDVFNQIEALNLKCKQNNESTAGAIVRALVGGGSMSRARVRSCLARDELIDKMKREGVCEEPPYESAFDRRCVVKEKPLDTSKLAPLKSERPNKLPDLDAASCRKWFKRAEIVRQMSMVCMAYIDEDLPAAINNHLRDRGCYKTLGQEVQTIIQSVDGDLKIEFDKTKNKQLFCATMLNYRREVYRMFYQPVPAPKYIER